MVFYKLNYNKFPIVEIIFKGEIIDEDLDRFFDEWLKIYDREKNFELYFDITKMDTPGMSFAYKLATFIQKIKTLSPQYLKQSIIIMNDGWFLRALFNTVFSITSPAAPLYIYWKDEIEFNINLDTIKKVFDEKKETFQCILP
jgi:hypothetical protein